MARMPRGIELDHEGQYHLRGQAAGPKGHYPLQQKANAEGGAGDGVLFLPSRGDSVPA